MQIIDRPFRFTWDFCIVWALFLIATLLLGRGYNVGPWYSNVAFLVLIPLFATFALYGPVLLVRQVIKSGSRGWFVARLFLSTVLTAALLLVGLLISGFYTESRAHTFAFILTAAATAYLNWKLERHEKFARGRRGSKRFAGKT